MELPETVRAIYYGTRQKFEEFKTSSNLRNLQSYGYVELLYDKGTRTACLVANDEITDTEEPDDDIVEVTKEELSSLLNFCDANDQSIGGQK